MRIDRDDSGEEIGFGSTIYVAPEFRNQAVATKLLSDGEAWMIARGMTQAVYCTATTNTKLTKLL